MPEEKNYEKFCIEVPNSFWIFEDKEAKRLFVASSEEKAISQFLDLVGDLSEMEDLDEVEKLTDRYSIQEFVNDLKSGKYQIKPVSLVRILFAALKQKSK